MKRKILSLFVLAMFVFGLFGGTPTPAHAAGELSPQRLGQMYSETGGDASRLLTQLNSYIDTQGGHLAAKSGYLGQIPFPAVVMSGSIDEISGSVVAIAKGAGFCICYVQDATYVDGEGRYVKLSDYLTPHLDLPGWQPDGGHVSAPVVVSAPAAQPCTCQAVAEPVASAPSSSNDLPALQGAMPVSVFASMWARTPKNDPAPLIAELDTYFNNALPIIGEQGAQIRVEAGSVVWTATEGKPVVLASTGQPAPGDLWVPLRVKDNFGVYYAYADVVLPGGGRYARTGPVLNPARDLPGWGS